MHHRPGAGAVIRPGAVSPSSPGAKRSFKDKFYETLQTAQDERIRAVHHQELQDRKSLAIAMLVQGRPQAFVDFFMLSQPQHQQPGTSSDGRGGADAAASTSTNSRPELSLQSLILLQEQLLRADAAGSAGQHEQAFDAHRTMAKHFTQLGVLDTAVFIWRKCLQVAVNAAWWVGELESSCALGLLYESLQHPQLAMACHERCLQLAQQLGRHDDAATASAQLVQVYAQQAEQCSRQGDATSAVSYYTKCMEAAQACGDAASAGAAAHHLGLLCQQQGDWQAALQHQRCYLELSRQAGDQQAEGRACTAFAECQQQLGDLPGALESLETYLALPRSQDARGQATACCKLGVLYHQQGKLQQAINHFERFYELARSLGERRLLEVARANLGVARSALLLPDYTALAQSDLQGLLAWKCRRQGL